MESPSPVICPRPWMSVEIRGKGEHCSNFLWNPNRTMTIDGRGRFWSLFSVFWRRRELRVKQWELQNDTQPNLQKIHFGWEPCLEAERNNANMSHSCLNFQTHFNLCASLFLPLSLQPHSKFLYYLAFQNSYYWEDQSTLKEKVYAVWWSGCAGNYMQKESESLETLSIVSLQYRTMYLVVIGNELCSQTHLLGYFTSLSPVSLICKMWVPLLVS